MVTIAGPSGPRTLKTGDQLTLVCETEGNPVPHVEWLRRGEPITETNRIYFSDDDSDFELTLTIEHVKESDSGELCKEAFGFGTYNSGNSSYEINKLQFWILGKHFLNITFERFLPEAKIFNKWRKSNILRKLLQVSIT